MLQVYFIVYQQIAENLKAIAVVSILLNACRFRKHIGE